MIKLPSGAELKVTLSPFAVGRDLYQAVLEELKDLKLDPKMELDTTFFKDIFCAAMTSKKIEKCVWKCLEKASYNDLRITEDTFEPEVARDDYFMVMFETAKVNLLPFMKSLSAQSGQVLGQLKSIQS